MRHMVLLAVLLLASSHVPLQARQADAGSAKDVPDGFVLWTSSLVKEASDRLEKNIGDKSILFETVGNWKGHSIYLVLRGKTADAEFHKTEEDVYIGQRGHATFIIGGEMVDPKNMPRKQMRASSIRGGMKRELRAGDILHVPRAIPHQLVIAPGEQFMYLLFKIDEEPLANLNPHTLQPNRPSSK
jgi:mannose-6-phosphate isomerase-like protein (cupin superfamily)